MGRLSQKELLSEGFSSLLKKGAQAVGAVGGALKSASDAGINAGLGDVAKGAASGWEKTGDALTGRVKKLEKFLDDQGLMKVNKPKPGETPIQEPVAKEDMKGNVAIVPIIQYDYTKDAETGKISGKEPMEGVKVETRKYKWKDNKWEMLRDKSRRSHGWGVDSAPKTEGTSQKDLLRQLTLLCD
tara:strand:+ start:49 stop:603 length:555 start_codon:yes stop_codon:yes gene_type:complete